MASKAKEGSYKGETTLLKDGRYPVTKNGKLDCGRVRNAVARAAQNNDTANIVKGGIKTYLKRCATQSKLLPAKKKSTNK
jgi:hypothetical protein